MDEFNDDDYDDGDDLRDPCHEFEHSVMFFLILAVAVGLVVAYCVLLAKR